MNLTRLLRNQLYEDEALFNNLLPYVKWDPETQLFIHSDASFWSIWELDPLLLTSTSDVQAYRACAAVQALLDSLDQRISAQFSWISTFDINDVLDECIHDYPMEGVAGWMARRWVRMFRNASRLRSL